MISGKEDAGNCYARGYHTLGSEVIDYVLDRIRLTADKCEGLQGFIAFHSFSGGTGSGLTSLILERLAVDYEKKTKLEYAIYPSRKIASGTTDPINTVLTMHKMAEFSDVAFMVDNEQMYNLVARNMNNPNPKFSHLNRLIAQTISMATCSLRFDGSINCNLPEFQTNLVPFKRCHFPVCSYAPFVSAEKAYHDSHTPFQLTSALFDPANMLVDCEVGNCLADCSNPECKHEKDVDIKHKYMAVCLLYRGDILPADANKAVTILKDPKKRTLQFVDWIGDGGFKFGINHSPPTVVPGGDLAKTMRAAMLISNTTKVSNVIQKMNYKFSLIRSKRSFNHWYIGAGMEEGELDEAQEDLLALQKDYEECALTNDEIEAGGGQNGGAE